VSCKRNGGISEEGGRKKKGRRKPFIRCGLGRFLIEGTFKYTNKEDRRGTGGPWESGLPGTNLGRLVLENLGGQGEWRTKKRGARVARPEKKKTRKRWDGGERVFLTQRGRGEWGTLLPRGGKKPKGGNSE